MPISKGRGGWQAQDYIALEGARQLRVMTHKTSRGGIQSDATGVTVKDGYETWEMFGDFREQIASNPTGRATEKTIAAQHAAALANIAFVVSRAKAFYVEKDAKATKDAAKEAADEAMSDFNYVGSPMHY
jgi:hypothetical protein